MLVLVDLLVVQVGYFECVVILVDFFVVGSNIDYFLCLLVEEMGKLFGQLMVVGNWVGGGGLVGVEVVVCVVLDGYIFGMVLVSMLVLNLVLNEMLCYDLLIDFMLIIILVMVLSVIVVVVSFLIEMFGYLIEFVWVRFGIFSYVSFGVGFVGYVLLEYFFYLVGVKFNYVFYCGSGFIQIDLLGGQIDVVSENIFMLMLYIQSGRLWVFVICDLKCLLQLFDVLIFKELGFEVVSQLLWFGLVGLVGLLKYLVECLCEVVYKVIQLLVFWYKVVLVVIIVIFSMLQEFCVLVRCWFDEYRMMVWFVWIVL